MEAEMENAATPFHGGVPQDSRSLAGWASPAHTILRIRPSGRTCSGATRDFSRWGQYTLVAAQARPPRRLPGWDPMELEVRPQVIMVYMISLLLAPFRASTLVFLSSLPVLIRYRVIFYVSC